MRAFRRGDLYAGCILVAITCMAAAELTGPAPEPTDRRPTPNLSTQTPLTDASRVEQSATETRAQPSDAKARSLAAGRQTGHATKIYRICRVTAYCDHGTTAAGVSAGVGQCAAPADIPFGSTVYVPALDQAFVVTDRTHRRFRHNTLDLFVPSKERCRQFGRSYLECVFTIPDDSPAYGKVTVPTRDPSQTRF